MVCMPGLNCPWTPTFAASLLSFRFPPLAAENTVGIWRFFWFGFYDDSRGYLCGYFLESWPLFPFLYITLYLDCKPFWGRVVLNFQWNIPIGRVGHTLRIAYTILIKINYFFFYFFFLIQFIEGPFEDYLKCLENPQVC